MSNVSSLQTSFIFQIGRIKYPALMERLSDIFHKWGKRNKVTSSRIPKITVHNFQIVRIMHKYHVCVSYSIRMYHVFSGIFAYYDGVKTKLFWAEIIFLDIDMVLIVVALYDMFSYDQHLFIWQSIFGFSYFLSDGFSRGLLKFEPTFWQGSKLKRVP